MDVQAIRQRVEAAIREDKRTADVERLISARLQGPQQVADVLGFVREFATSACDLMETIAGAASVGGMSGPVRPFLDTASARWSRLGNECDPVPLLALLDAAYATHATLRIVGDRYADRVGRPLLSVEIAPATDFARSLLDKLMAEVIDDVAQDRLSAPPLQDAFSGLTAWGGTLDIEGYSAPQPPAVSVPALVVSAIRDPGAVQPPQPSKGATLYRVWFGTTRQPVDPNDPQRGFTNQPDPHNTMHYGNCTVQIPQTHRFGSTGKVWWRRWIRLQFSDDRLKVVKRSQDGRQGFFTDLREELREVSEVDRVIVVYVHGYNVSFDEAAVRAAQIGFDLKVAGVTAFFSWPSCATAPGYLIDGNRIEGSEQHLADFLVNLSREADARTVHIIAHSMGNRGLARAVQRITAQASAAAGLRFGQIILAAPDIDVALFRDLAGVYPKISDRTTMYVSRRDRALATSKFLQKSHPAGFTPPVTVVPPIDTIEVADIDVTLLGHSYYAEAEPLLYDMHALLRNNPPPSARIRLKAMADGAARYWAIGG